MLLILDEVLQVVARERVVVLRIDVLLPFHVIEHPVRRIVHPRLQDKIPVLPCAFDESERTVRAEVAADGEMFELRVTRRVIVCVPGPRRHEIGAGDCRLHRGEAGARNGIKQRAQDPVPFNTKGTGNGGFGLAKNAWSGEFQSSTPVGIAMDKSRVLNLSNDAMPY